MTFNPETFGKLPLIPFVGADTQTWANYRSNHMKRLRKLKDAGLSPQGPSREQRMAALPSTRVTLVRRAVRPESIVRACAAYYDITVKSLRGRSRVRKLMPGRHMAIYLFRELTGASFPTIGRDFKLDHSTIMHAYRKIAGESMSGGLLVEDIATIKAKLLGTNGEPKETADQD